MWTDSANIANYALPGGAAAEDWEDEVVATLPGAEDNLPTVNVVGDAASGYTVTMQLNWKIPAENSAHKYTTVAYINTNRSEEHRVGKEGVNTCRTRWWP